MFLTLGLAFFMKFFLFMFSPTLLILFCFLLHRKENTVLRARVESNRVSVIPNAVDTKAFTPDPTHRAEQYGMMRTELFDCQK